MHIATNGDWCVHFQQIGLVLQNLGPLLDDEQGLLLGEATFAIEMLFEKLEVWLVAIMGGSKLIVGGRMEGGSLHL